MQPQQGMRLCHQQLGDKLRGGQVAIPVVQIHAVGGDHTQIGRPDLVKTLHQGLARGLLGVDLHGHKACGERIDHLGV
jgi:hypothetical protein